MFKNFYKNKYNKGPTCNTSQRYTGGVTLIELLVVISIFLTISLITVFSYGKFRSSLSIQNLSDDIALSVRKAQGYAISVQHSGTGNSFDYGYGVHFTANPTGSLYSGSSKSFVLFANVDNDQTYDYNSSSCGSPTSGNECLEVLNIASADKISQISVGSNGTESSINTNGTLDIFFKRPSPEPTFCARNTISPSCEYSNNISYIKIKISTEADPNVYKIITISNNGQISVSSS